jgi:hypothetical protein
MDDMGTILKRPFLLLAAALFALLAAQAVRAAGPVETSVFAVQGVAVDVTDTDASSAKNKALIEVQIKAFRALAERLGSPEVVAAAEAMEEKEVLTYLRSLSIEQESISPGRYQGKLTVRFLPDKIKSLYGKFGVRVSSEQGPSFLVLPMWKSANGTQLWEDNPWRQAWINLRAEQSQVPIIVPLGDLDDSEIISAQDVLAEDELKIEAIRRRYDVKTVLVAFAEPDADGGIRATLNGNTPLGRITFDKVYRAESGDQKESAELATKRFHAVMLEKFRSDASKQAAATEAKSANRRQSLSVAVPFAGPSEWNRLRSRILSTPGVVALDVSSLGGDGAVVKLTVMGGMDDIENRFRSSGLQLSQAGGTWVIQPL